VCALKLSNIFNYSFSKTDEIMLKAQSHSGHDKHLCYLAEQNAAAEQLKPLVKNAKYICRGCGRAAAKAENLCSPEPL
jgi:hypothetical protein